MDKEKMMSDFFKGSEDVLNPPYAYAGGGATFSVGILDSCSKYNGKSNMFKDYLQEEYIDKIEKIIGSHIFCYELEWDLKPNGNGKGLHLSLPFILRTICYYLVGDISYCSNPELLNYDEHKEYLRKFLRQYTKTISMIEMGNVSRDYKNMEEKLKTFYIKSQKSRKFSSYFVFLDELYKMINTFLGKYDQLAEICKKTIDFKKLDECLDLEKFYFAMCYICLAANMMSDEEKGILRPHFSYVIQYMRNLEELGDNYDIVLKIRDNDRKSHKINLAMLKKDYLLLMSKHPEVRNFNGNFDIMDGCQNFNEISEKIKEAQKDKELQASWTFIKKGEGGYSLNSEKSSSFENTDSLEKKQFQDELELEKRISFFENSPYLYRLEGKNKFKGYVAYVYGNGYVVFEKFYKGNNSFELAEGATYVMDITNFLEMSKKTKTEIIEYIKSGNTDVRRKYHSKNWEKSMKQIIDGNGYDQDVKSTIENLVASGLINKKEGVK